MMQMALTLWDISNRRLVEPEEHRLGRQAITLGRMALLRRALVAWTGLFGGEAQAHKQRRLLAAAHHLRRVKSGVIQAWKAVWVDSARRQAGHTSAENFRTALLLGRSWLGWRALHDLARRRNLCVVRSLLCSNSVWLVGDYVWGFWRGTCGHKSTMVRRAWRGGSFLS